MPQQTDQAEYGPTVQLPAPDKSIIPIVKIAKAIGWPPGMKPTAAPGLMKQAGSGASPSANRITLLRDPGFGDGPAQKHIFLRGLNSPFGMALIDHTLYVADSDAILKFPYQDGRSEIREKGTKLTDLPAGTVNHHWTKSLIASPDGTKLFVGVGSNSNAGENGLAAEEQRAAVWMVNVNTGEHRVYANGLRNPVGLAWQPDSRALWLAVNERDELGDHLPPDYMAVVPDYALGAHTASLGLCWSGGSLGARSFVANAAVQRPPSAPSPNWLA